MKHQEHSSVTISQAQWIELNGLGSDEERELKCQVQFGMTYQEATMKYADDWLETNVDSGKIILTKYSFDTSWNDVVLRVTFETDLIIQDNAIPDVVLKSLPVLNPVDNSAIIMSNRSNSIWSSYGNPTTVEFTLSFTLACIHEQTITTLKKALRKSFRKLELNELVDGFEAQIRTFKQI